MLTLLGLRKSVLDWRGVLILGVKKFTALGTKQSVLDVEKC